MGIHNLLQILKPITKQIKVKELSGKTAVIDIMSWLYKGAFSCAYELGNDQETLQFLAFPIKMLKMLIVNGVKPICVFDGCHLKAKAETEKNRA